MAPDPETAAHSAAGSRGWPRMALLGTLSVGAIVTLMVLVYELARASVPQHRAALEHLVRAQTGLDVRFTELGLRWGWYGPEAVFRDVELDEPGSAEALLRAPELVVGFDAWRTLRSGHPEAGRIELVAPEIDFANAPRSGRVVAPVGSPLARVSVLQRWRGGRIDIEGGTFRLPDPSGNGKPFSLQIRRATLRRSDDEWSIAGLVFLPERLGRSARITLNVSGDLGVPVALSGALHVEAHQLLFPAVHELLAGDQTLGPAVPAAGNGDVTMDLRFEHGRLSNVDGSVHAGTLAFDSAAGPRLLLLDRVRAGWQASRVAAGWRARVTSAEPLSGTLAGVQVSAAVRELRLDWDPGRAAGDRLRASGRLENVSLSPRSRSFSLAGMSVGLAGTDSRLQLDVQSRTARLDWPQSQQAPLTDVRVSSLLQFSSGPEGWQLSTDALELEHQRASLSLSGSLRGENANASVAAQGPRISATGRLDGADIPLVMHVLGDDTAQVYGAVASRLKSGRILAAEFALQGPVGDLPVATRGGGFTGSLTLRGATLSGGDLWPDAQGVDARVEWHGPRIQATVDAGRAGPFQLAAAKAQWDAAGDAPTRLTGHVTGRLEDALAWVRDHPSLQEFTPGVDDIDANGEAAFDFNVSIPADRDAEARQPKVLARVSTFVNGVAVRAVPGLPPLEDVTGSFVFDSGRVQRSVLTGAWLGGPVALRVGERRIRGVRAVTVQAQGTLKSQELATLANAAGTVAGFAEWNGELIYQPQPRSNDSSQPPRWTLRADSNLLGVESSLPEPFAKPAVVAVPVHLEVTGTADSAELRANVGDRLRSVFALQRQSDADWRVDRGTVRFGGAAAMLPSEPAVFLRGRLNQLDLPAYALAWQRLRKDLLPAIRAQVAAGRMLVGGRPYDEVSLKVEHTAAGTDLLIDSAQVAGIARWPRSPAMTRAGAAAAAQPVELRFTRLQLPNELVPGEAVGLLAAMTPGALLSVDELNWRGRSLGRLTANVAVQDNLLVVEDLRLVNGTHEGRGALRCQTAMPQCRLAFRLDSSDATLSLVDFGLAPDLTAESASVNGDVEWRPIAEQPWLATARGTLSMRLAEGALLTPGTNQSTTGPARPFGLFAVPALLKGLDASGSPGAPLAKEQRNLHFARLEADFELHDGEAFTSNLHFDGDAEILMRGRTGLVSRDYDQQVWILSGEERLPAPVRRFGATPRVAAAWLSLRDLFSAGDRSRAVLRLQGSWDDPMVVAEN